MPKRQESIFIYNKNNNIILSKKCRLFLDSKPILKNIGGKKHVEKIWKSILFFSHSFCC